MSCFGLEISSSFIFLIYLTSFQYFSHPGRKKKSIFDQLSGLQLQKKKKKKLSGLIHTIN